ncbi:YdcF family protein [Terriglobus tenax]|uniref:YdcF family protein n=1 Tax=Terriglobus tenax TaxID=1111115 RepID=UPI0021E0E8FD|nr:YdcF family protein [Terriglobus tenax]
MRTLKWTVLVLLVAVVVVLGGLETAHWTLPLENTQQAKFDSIIVLGTPSKADGTPSPEQRERVLEGVRQWKAGVAPVLIMTGGAAHNKWTEAHSMAVYAEQQGVPASAVIEEGQAQNTVQNIYYSNQILQAHGWHSAEVVSSKSHLPRAGMILSHYPAIKWKVDGSARPAEYGWWREAVFEFNEAQYCWTLRRKGFPKSKFMPQ